jgi:hypothetical protein
MMGSKRGVACAAVVVSLLGGSQAAADPPRRLDETLSFEMLRAEESVRTVEPEKFRLLRSVLERATLAAASRYSRPRYRSQAMEVLDAVQVTFAEHNFLQPPKDSRVFGATLGEALTPLNLTREERRQLLAPGELNGFRQRYISAARPLYFIDDEIAAQLFISVGERMGWNIHLVNVGDHYFVRWQLAPDIWLNWDWTAGGPTRNTSYAREAERNFYYRTWQERRRYMANLSPRYARATYLYFIARKVNSADGKHRILKSAMELDATHEAVQNSLAWLYATDPVLSRTYGPQAVQYALSAWSSVPNDPSAADTVACSFAAAGQHAMGVPIQRFAIERLRAERRDRQIPDYTNRLRQIEAGGTCSATTRPPRPGALNE